MTQQEIQELMIDQLKPWNDEGVELNENTVHNEVLSAKDGFRGIELDSSKNIYQMSVRGPIIRRAKKEGKKPKDANKAWPANWMNLTVAELAAKILPLVFLLFSLSSFAQLNMNVSTIKTQLGKDAIKIGLTYLYQLDSIYKDKDLFVANKSSYFQVKPQFDIQTGTEDAFSSIQAKLTGAILKFKSKSISGFEAPDLSRTFWLFPISLGAEMNNTFDRINGIFEIGAIPHWNTVTNSAPDWLKQIKLGLFAQAGYKFKGDTLGDVGGEIDQSLEKAYKALLRIKGSAEVNIIKPVVVSGVRFGLVGSADAWYDLLNNAIYHKIIGEARFFLVGDNYMSAFYQHGSGAPNFNQGDQWGMGLTISF